MSMEYIRKVYGVPAKRGGKVKINTHLGVVFDRIYQTGHAHNI